MSSDEFTTEDEDDDDSFEPIHFRECLRLLDQSLVSLPHAWFAHQTFDQFIDPQLTLHKPCKTRRIYPIKTDFLDNIRVRPTASQISPSDFSISNPNFSKQIQTFVEQLQIRPTDVDFRLANLIQLKPFAYPRTFPFEKSNKSMGKLFIFLPSKCSSTKQILRYENEIHTLDLPSSFSYTLIPNTDECSLTIEGFSRRHRSILIYDLFPLKPSVYFNLRLPESTLHRVRNSLDLCLENSFQKLVVPFTRRTFRSVGSLLFQASNDDFLLYQAVIQPNRSSNSTRHVCRLISQMTFLNESPPIEPFEQIEFCLANCNEIYSGSESIEPVFCLIPKRNQFDLFTDNLPLIFDYLQTNPDCELINWLISHSIRPPKRLLHLSILNHELLQFFSPIGYEDLMRLYPISPSDFFQKVFQSTDTIHDMIQFLGVLSSQHKIESNRIIVLIHECLKEIFRRQPALIDLTNLLTLLSSIDAYHPSCQTLVEEIIRRTTTVDDYLRAILIPNLIQIQKKRKSYPTWLNSLHKHCLALLENHKYQPVIPSLQLLNENCCQLCRELNRFFRDDVSYEKLVFIRREKIEHLEMILKDHSNLILQPDSMTVDRRFYRIHLTKISIYDQEISREINILKTILEQFHFHQQSDRQTHKRFKTFFVQ